MNHLPDSKTSVTLIVAIAVAILMLVASRLYDLAGNGLWLDEVFSLELVRLAWASMFQAAINDAVHPPFYYVLLKGWVAIGGESLLWIKALSTAFGILIVIPLYFLCREMRLPAWAFCLVLILTAPNAYLIYFSQELRMYSLLAFLSVMSMWLFMRFLRDGSRGSLALLFIINLLLVYTQYFGWMTVLGELMFAALCYRTRLKAVGVQFAAVLLCFLPWCIFVVFAMDAKGGLSQNLGWISKPSFSAIALLLADFHGRMPFRFATTIGLAIFLFPVVWWMWRVFKDGDREDRERVGFLGLVSALPIVFAFAASLLLTNSVWVERYMIIAVIPYLLLIAVAIVRIPNTILRAVFGVAVVSWALTAGLWNTLYQKSRVDWPELANDIMEVDRGQPRPVLFTEDWAGLPLKYSFSGSGYEPKNFANSADLASGEFWLVQRKTGPLPPPLSNCTKKEEFSEIAGGDTITAEVINCAR